MASSPIGSDTPTIGASINEQFETTVYMDGSGSFRAKNLIVKFDQAVSRIGITWMPLIPGTVPSSDLVRRWHPYFFIASYLGDQDVGSVGTQTQVPDTALSMYRDITPADWIIIDAAVPQGGTTYGDSLTATGSTSAPSDYWRFTIIGSNNLKLGVVPTTSPVYSGS